MRNTATYLVSLTLLWSLAAVEVSSFSGKRFFRHHRYHQRGAPLHEAMQVWIDVRSKSPSPADRLEQADALLVDQISDSETPNCFVVDSQQRLVQNDEIVGKIVDVSTKDGQDEALAAVGSVDWILADCSGDWKMIPAENLIVAAKSTGTRLAFVVQDEKDVVGLVRALELGVDALCVQPDVSFWNDVIKARQERNQSQSASDSTQPEMEPQVVLGKCYRSEKSAVVADRVCVDLVQALSPLEGCWVGSSAKILALILSEAATSSLVPSRPFRVNAGPVHSYILMGDGKTTKYLCELEAGDEVVVYDSKTDSSRSIAIGRLKVEVRPCLMVNLANDNGDKSQVFLQQAETVRLGQGGESFIRVTELSSNPEESVPILLRCSVSGTHIGKAYTGKVVEK